MRVLVRRAAIATGVVVSSIVLGGGCSRSPGSGAGGRHAAAAAADADSPGGSHMMQVEIEGTPDELAGITGRQGPAGLDLARRVDVLPDGRWRAHAMVDSQQVVDELKERGLTVRVVMDEDEVNRRIDLDMEMMRDAGNDGPSS